MNGYSDYNPPYAYQPSQQGYQQPPPPPPPPATGGMHLPPGGSWILPPSSQANGNGALPKQIMGNTELVKVTAKSCSNCRTRKVKCDRRYPDCSRCVKRKETCDYGDDVSIALRPTWVLATENGDDSSPSSAQPSPTTHRPPYQPTPPAARPPYAGSAYPYPPPRALPAEPAFEQTRSFRSVSNMQHHQALTRTRRDEEDGQGAPRENFTRLWENFLSASNLGASSSDWRLAVPTMASSLTVHLIDASMHSCCFHLPAFHAFAPFVNYYKQNINTLDLASQVVVGILTSLGARASPHSALLGIAGPDIENGKASLDLVLSAGQRRENAWRAIVNRATELCSKPEILQVPSARNAQTLVAFVQMLMLAEAKPKTARFFLRTAMGVFRDMQHSDLSPEEVQSIKSAVGPTLYESDSRIAAYLSMPVVISDGDLDEYFEGTDVRVIDLASEDLGPLLDDILDPSHGLITRPKLDRALALTGYFVCAVQRCFSSISSSRRTSPRFLTTIPQLWTYVDRAHAAVQRLHRRLVQLDYVPEGCDEHHSVDYDLLIGVRMDERLLDVVHLAHEWMKKQRMSNTLAPEHRTALEELLATSERRVRKCLKLLAFYSKVFVDSLDKHVVYHLFTQLEALPDWAEMAAQCEGEMTDYGPLPQECALTETELDWFTAALELACFFTPLGHERLRQLTAARNARRRPEAAVVDQWTFDLSVPTPAATLAQPRDVQVSLPLPHSHGHGHTHPHAAPHTNNNSPTWTFDSYGTPSGFVDNLSPPSLQDQTPRSSVGTSGSDGHHLTHQQPPPFGQSSFELPPAPGTDGSYPPPPPSLPSLTISGENRNPYGYTAAAGPDGPLSPSALLVNPNGGMNGKRDSVVVTPGAGAGAGAGAGEASSWLAGYDYSAMLNAETSRTGTTPRASMGATITELPDEPNGGGGGGGGGGGMSPPPPPPPVPTGQAGMGMGIPPAQVPLGATPQGWVSYGGNGGGGGW